MPCRYWVRLAGLSAAGSSCVFVVVRSRGMVVPRREPWNALRQKCDDVHTNGNAPTRRWGLSTCSSTQSMMQSVSETGSASSAVRIAVRGM
ncbi:hypothetical protein BCR34DRAFT_386418 [Clohesyomyces aquaticus]|uniref:Uncharacterized protein n=1 Tax=Clohesyomyces aquaticus TaxID=1231657 RepID=A0A1Y1ZFA3_9PLEO|nr:hypothetical protein BCR34DRAFT_386418 [Clohesyomyces aquaticus]